MYCGTGYDIHRLVKNKKLILGGIEIKFNLGLIGHSDADVLIHSIIDALLGATALGDIGELFPGTNKKYKNISSVILLQEVHKKIIKENFAINNIDATIIAEKPKLSEYKNLIKKNLADILRITENQINIKAKTNEGLGYIGKGKAIACITVATLKKGKP